MERITENQKFHPLFSWAFVFAGLMMLRACFFCPGIFFGALMMFFGAVFFYFMELRTEFDEEGIGYQFYPFHGSMRQISWDEIDEVWVRTYRPIREYGGWGIRYGFKGIAYNVRGNHGVQIILKDGSRILIGTQMADELYHFLNSQDIEKA